MTEQRQIKPVQLSLDQFLELGQVQHLSTHSTDPLLLTGMKALSAAETDRLLHYPKYHEIFLVAAQFYLAADERECCFGSTFAQLIADAVERAIVGTKWTKDRKQAARKHAMYAIQYYQEFKSFAGDSYLATADWTKAMQAHKFHFLVSLSILLEAEGCCFSAITN